MKRQAPKRRKESAEAENESGTSEVAVQTEVEVPERDTVPAVAEDVEIKKELSEQSEDSDDEEMSESDQEVEPFSIVNHGKRLLAALNSEYLTDVTIIVGEEEIKCHSNIVSFASPKLAAILTEKEPRLPDVDPRHFRLLLQIIYSGTTSELQKDLQTLLQLGHVAKDLQVKAAIAYCADSLDYKLDIDNLWPILDFADLVHNAKLLKSGFKTFRENASYILQAEAFSNITGAKIKSILQQEVIYNVTELQLFQACVAWANANSEEVESRRTALSSALCLVRFRLFSAEEFAKHVCPTGLLRAEDDRDILRSLVTGENFIPEGFSQSTSSRDPSQVVVLELKSSGERKALNKFPKNNIKTSFRIDVSKNIFIHGVKLLAFRLNLPDGCFYEENVSVTLKELTCLTGNPICNEASFHGQVQTGDMISITFQHPIQLYDYFYCSLHLDYQNGEKYTAYDLYKADKIKCTSGLKVKVLDQFFAPPCLHLILADKTPAS